MADHYFCLCANISDLFNLFSSSLMVARAAAWAAEENQKLPVAKTFSAPPFKKKEAFFTTFLILFSSTFSDPPSRHFFEPTKAERACPLEIACSEFPFQCCIQLCLGYQSHILLKTYYMQFRININVKSEKVLIEHSILGVKRRPPGLFADCRWGEIFERLKWCQRCYFWVADEVGINAMQGVPGASHSQPFIQILRKCK